MSAKIGHMKELYRLDYSNVLTAQYRVPTRAGVSTTINVNALLGAGSKAFVNINVTTFKGYEAAVEVSMYRYVFNLTISLATVKIVIDRFPTPYHHRPELTIADGEIHAEVVVRGFRMRLCCCYG
jgi:hypothetical protein